MNLSSDQVLAGLIGSVLYAACGYILRKARQYLILRKKKNFFGEDFSKNKSYFVTLGELTLRDDVVKTIQGLAKPSFPFKKENESKVVFSAGHVVSTCEIRAAQHIYYLCNNGKGPSLHICGDSQLPTNNCSRISLGGHASNSQSSETQDDSTNHLLKMHRAGSIISADAKEGKYYRLYSDELVADPDHEYDYGLILRVEPKHYKNRVWIACQGMGEWGTSGAAYYLCYKWKELSKRRNKSFLFFHKKKDSHFAAVIRVKRGNDKSAEILRYFNDREDVMDYGDKNNLELIPYSQFAPQSSNKTSNDTLNLNIYDSSSNCDIYTE